MFWKKNQDINTYFQNLVLFQQKYVKNNWEISPPFPGTVWVVMRSDLVQLFNWQETPEKLTSNPAVSRKYFTGR